MNITQSILHNLCYCHGSGSKAHWDQPEDQPTQLKGPWVQPHTCKHFLGRLTVMVNGRIEKEEEDISIMMQKSLEVLPSLQTRMWSPWREKWSPAEIQPRGAGDGCSTCAPTSTLLLLQHSIWLTLVISYLPLQNNHNPSPLNALFLLSDLVIIVSVISIPK